MFTLFANALLVATCFGLISAVEQEPKSLWQMDSELRQQYRSMFYDLGCHYDEKNHDAKEVLKAEINAIKSVYDVILSYVDSAGRIHNESELRSLLLGDYGHLLHWLRIDSVSVITYLEKFSQAVRATLKPKEMISAEVVTVLTESDRMHLAFKILEKYANKVDGQRYFIADINEIQNEFDRTRATLDSFLRNIDEDKTVLENINEDEFCAIKVMPISMTSYCIRIIEACKRYQEKSQDLFDEALLDKVRSLQAAIISYSIQLKNNSVFCDVVFNASLTMKKTSK